MVIKMKPRVIELKYGERIIAVVPEFASGPGWGNAPAWVYIVSNDGTLRQECIQPMERSLDLHTLFHAGEAMCRSLIASIPVVKSKIVK